MPSSNSKKIGHKRKSHSTVQLTSSQQLAFDELLNGRENIFLTGAPGTGKSFLIREFLKASKEKIPVVASTGAAAILVGGRTFHSFFGLGIMHGGPNAVIKHALKNGRLRKRLRDLSAIVIDEVSMLSAEALDTAEAMIRIIRESDAPWGGVRIITVGDFAQLPPISRSGKKSWCFLGTAWNRSDFKKLTLKEVVRTEDEQFLQILEDVRWGKLSDAVEEYLNKRVVSSDELESDVPHIFPRRTQTDAYNRARLAELEHPLRTYETEYGGDDRYIEQLKKDAPIPPILELKKKAMVMLRMNDPKQRYVNGTIGMIVELFEDSLLVQIKSRTIELDRFTFTLLNGDGKEVAYAINFPVTLAYANTIHKMQGATLERAHLDLKALWEPGQAYVALSRAQSGEGVTLVGWDPRSIKADRTVQDFYDREHSTNELPPEMTCPGG